jgi:hypothetical protein
MDGSVYLGMVYFCYFIGGILLVIQIILSQQPSGAE